MRDFLLQKENVSELVDKIKVEIQSNYHKLLKRINIAQDKSRNTFIDAIKFLTSTMNVMIPEKRMKKVIVMTDGLCVEDLSSFELAFLESNYYMSYDFVLTGILLI